MATQDEINNWYSYHAPEGQQIAAYEAIREKGREFALTFDNYAPACADSAAAHRKLREVVMAMNLAIACNT